MGNLPSPIRSKLFNRYGNEYYQVCVCAMQGYRANMEDCHLVELLFKNHSNYSLFAIFDGHNGRKAAQYLTKHLVNNLDKLSSLDNNIDIQNVILTMDKEFCKSIDGENGSTIVFALVKVMNDNDKQYELRIFWAGDSRAILIRNNDCTTFKQLTIDHRPDNPFEKERIELAQGIIINNRVDSKLAVSRAFGDCNLKNNDKLLFSKQRVTSLLQFTERIICNINDTLFLFCDGLVEYLTNRELIYNLYKHIPLYQDPVYALGYLFDEILDGGSKDNMSAIMINFKSGQDYGKNNKHKTFLPGPLYMTRNNKKYLDAYLKNAKDFGHNDSPQLRRAAYREDLKFLKKYNNNHSLTNEIEQVIKEIDNKQNNQKQSTTQSIPQQIISRGSTEIINDDGDTPPLSDDEQISQLNKSLTIIPTNNNNHNTNNSTINPKKRSFEDMNHENDEKDMDIDINTNLTKRRKSNNGQTIVEIR